MPQRRKAVIADPRAIPQPRLAEIVALKAVAQGSATPEQQKLFMAWLVKDACAFDESPIYFGHDSVQKTYLMLGRQRVALILRGYLATPIEKFKDGQSSEQVT